jgi:hypothetical protein
LPNVFKHPQPDEHLIRRVPSSPDIEDKFERLDSYRLVI